MAHAVLLFDPDFLFVADDDTYIRLPIISYGSIMSNIILNELKDSPIVLGQLTGGGKITTGGR